MTPLELQKKVREDILFDLKRWADGERMKAAFVSGGDTEWCLARADEFDRAVRLIEAHQPMREPLSVKTEPDPGKPNLWQPTPMQPLKRLALMDTRGERWLAAEARIASAAQRSLTVNPTDLKVVEEEQDAWDTIESRLVAYDDPSDKSAWAPLTKAAKWLRSVVQGRGAVMEEANHLADDLDRARANLGGGEVRTRWARR